MQENTVTAKKSCVEVTNTGSGNFSATSKQGNCSGNTGNPGSQNVELYKNGNPYPIAMIQKNFMLQNYTPTYISKGAKETVYTYKGDIPDKTIIDSAQAAQAGKTNQFINQI